jgi:hypothetical protein
MQALTTLTSIALLWWAAVFFAAISWWLTGAAVVLLTLFTLRVFALMHECGHASLFRSRRLNRATGFVLGVLSGMPQYVWSQHHNYHHAHNGDWDKYRGPYATRSVDEYAALSGGQQRAYRVKCSVAAAALAARACRGLQDALLEIIARVLAYVLEQCSAARPLGADVLADRDRPVHCGLHRQRLDRRRRRHRAVHGATQFRSRLCERQPALGLHRRGHQWHQLSAAAGVAQLVHGEYGLSPHSPSVGQHS